MNFFSGKIEEFEEYWQKELEKRTITKEEKEIIIEALNFYENRIEKQRFLNSTDEKLLNKCYLIDTLLDKLGG